MPCHPSHRTRISDSSLYDEVCTICGATDRRGDYGDLERPCTTFIDKCPFCGGIGVLIGTVYDVYSYSVTVRCTQCQAQVNDFYHTNSSIDKSRAEVENRARMCWNRRVK